MTHTPTPAHQPGMTGGSMSERAPEATDPTPGEVGLSDFQQLGSEIHRFRCTNPDCRHYSDQGYFTPRDNDAASAVLASDWLAARTADRDAERDAEAEKLRQARDEWRATAFGLEDEKEAAEAREAELRATDFAAILREQLTAEYGDEEWGELGSLRRINAALRAALTTPPTTEDGKR